MHNLLKLLVLSSMIIMGWSIDATVNLHIIKADEIAEFRTLRGQSEIFGININYERFVERDKGNLLCKDINKLEVLHTIPTPEITGKTLYGAKIISQRFVLLTFGVACENNQKIQTKDTNYEDHYTDTEFLVWDLEQKDTFKVVSPDFTSTELLLNELNNHERMLTHEVGYTADGDNKYRGRYRFYDLITRSFLEQVVFDFSLINTTFHTVNDQDGNSVPKYAVQYNAGEQSFRTITEIEGKLVIGDILFSTHGLNQSVIDVEEGHLILYKPGGAGFVIPYIVDLKRKRPTEACLLSEGEIDELRSDVYDVDVAQGVLRYTEHFDERKIVVREIPGKEVGPKGRLLKALYEKLSPKYPNSRKTRTFEEFLQFIDEELLKDLKLIIKENPDEFLNAFSEKEQQAITKLLDSGFLSYAIQKSPLSILAKKIRPTESSFLKTANGRFDMPIYFTRPETPNSDGWFIIDVHGGPHAREFNELDMMSQFWASRGLPLFRLNIRGSTGFGADYAEASDGKWWDVVDDIQAAIKWVIESDYGSNTIVTGASFGGYAAAAAFAKGYTKYAIAENGVFDLEQDLTDVKEGNTKYPKYIPTDLEVQFGDTKAIREANSVTTHLNKSDGKMLIFAGVKDDNCLPKQSVLLFETMNELGNHAQLVTMAEEGHSPSKPENLLMMLRVQEAFLAEITGAPCEPGGYCTIENTSGAKVYKTQAITGEQLKEEEKQELQLVKELVRGEEVHKIELERMQSEHKANQERLEREFQERQREANDKAELIKKQLQQLEMQQAAIKAEKDRSDEEIRKLQIENERLKGFCQKRCVNS